MMQSAIDSSHIIIARDAMTQDVIAVSEQATVGECVRMLNDKKINSLPVVATNGSLLGTVSWQELLLHHIQLQVGQGNIAPIATREHNHREVAKSLANELTKSLSVDKTPVSEIMVQQNCDVTEGMPIKEVADMMLSFNLPGVFITRDNQVVGIITYQDMLRVIREF